MKDKKEVKKLEDRELPAKFVKQANMWCRTIFKDNKQVIEWYLDRELTKKV